MIAQQPLAPGLPGSMRTSQRRLARILGGGCHVGCDALKRRVLTGPGDRLHRGSFERAVCHGDPDHGAVVLALGVRAWRCNERRAGFERRSWRECAQDRDTGLGERAELQRRQLARHLLAEHARVQIEDATHATAGCPRCEAVPQRRRLQL